MATKRHHFQELPGTRDLYVLLNIINNKDEYTKILSEMETLRASANKAIEEKGLAGNIENLYNDAKADRLQAKRELDEARETAQNLIIEGQEALNQCLEEVQGQKASLEMIKSKQMESLNAEREELEEREKSLSKKEAKLTKQEAAIAKQRESITLMQTEVEEKRQVLSDSLERLQ